MIIVLDEVDPGQVCGCADELSPRTPKGHTVRLLIDDTQRGFYCMGCLPAMIKAMIAVRENAALMRASTKVGDTVLWSGMPMTVLDRGESGVMAEDQQWYAWEAIEPADGGS